MDMTDILKLFTPSGYTYQFHDWSFKFPLSIVWGKDTLSGAQTEAGCHQTNSTSLTKVTHSPLAVVALL